MKEIITAKGILKYRMPNIVEAYKVLNSSGVASGETSTLLLKANIVAVMEPFIDFTGISGASSYDDILNDIEDMIAPLSEIADEIIAKSFSAFKKKT